MTSLPTIDINAARSLLAGSTDPVQQGTRLFETYGDLVRIELGSAQIYGVFAPELAQSVLEGEGFGQRSALVADFLRPLASPEVGIAACNESARWAHDRTTVEVTLDPRARERRTVDAVVRLADAHIERWLAEHDDGARLRVDEALDRLVAEWVLTTVFCRLGVEPQTLVGLMHDAAGELVQRAYAAEPAPWLLPRGTSPERTQPLAEVKALAREVVKARHKAGRDFDDLLGELLFHHRDGHDADAERLVEEVSDQAVTMAGMAFFPTVSLLHWSLVALSLHPGVERAIAAELKAQLGGQRPSADVLPRLTTLAAFIEEVLRLWPPVIGIGRRAISAQELGGHAVAAGSTVMVGIHQLHRHPASWPNPQGFDPERFIDEDARAGRHPYAHCPFGGGARACVGRALVTMTTTLMLARLIPRLRLELEPYQEIGRHVCLPSQARPDVRSMRLRRVGS